jgi:hypothetical protein
MNMDQAQKYRYALDTIAGTESDVLGPGIQEPNDNQLSGRFTCGVL